jgi:hypothetical protein
MLDVLLTDAEEAYCLQAGLAVNGNKERLGVGRGGGGSRYADLDADANRVNSFRAECALAKVLGIPYSIEILSGGDGGVDLRLPVPCSHGQTLQMKWRGERNRDIATDGLNFHRDLKCDIYVLAWPSVTLLDVTLVGFCTKRDWLKRILARPPVRMRGDKWEMKYQDLRPIAGLIRAVERVAA